MVAPAADAPALRGARQGSRRTWASWAGAALFLLALGLRLGAAVGDLPHVYDYDEPLFVGLDIGPMWLGHTIEPAQFHHPAVYKNLSAGVLAAASVVTGWDGGDLGQTGVYGDRLVANPMPWVSIRILVAVLGAAAVALCWDAARRFGAPDWAAALAGLLGAVAPALIGIATRIASDGFLIFAAMLAVWTLAWTLQRPSLERQAVLGATIGLAIGTKYTSAPMLVFVLVVPWVAVRSWPRRLSWCVAAGVAAVAAFVATNPFIPVRFDEFYSEMRAQNLVYLLGQYGQSGRPLQFSLRSLFENAGPLALGAVAAVPLLLAGAGTKRDGIARSNALVGGIAISLGVIGWVAFQSRYELRATRNIMPLVLPVCVLGSLALEPSWKWLQRRGAVWAGVAAMLVSGWMGVQVAKGSFDVGREFNDERAEARTWLADNVAPGDVVMGELGTPWIGRADIEQREVPYLADVPQSDLNSGRIDWIVSSSERSSGIYQDQARWRYLIANYDLTLSAVCEWHSFRSWGTEIRVGRVCDPTSVGSSPQWEG
ncbi:MAG: glycosyltransferase family 39 protein [Microthrixaceae bacterium]